MTDLAGLREALPKLTGRDREFGKKLLQDAGMRGLSENQKPWVDKLIQRATTPPAEPQQIGPEFMGVVELLDAAAKKLQMPRMMFKAGDKTYKLTIAGSLSRFAGTINIKSGKKGEDVWYGRVTRDGMFHAARALDVETKEMITAALKFVAADPAGAAKMYGVATSSCCFCRLALTDKRSIAAGYGPDCADNWGLPWGIA